ncbi:MAG: hypothetical protein JXA50_01585 [Deltaproteobacteria bacterium]|nr:hypothetical protein [Deltaproteobacteria bacterium]
MIPTIEDRVRMEQEALPDHISVNDNGKRVFAECHRCGLYITVWADDHTRQSATKDFIQRHADCQGLPVYGEDELRDDEPYFDGDEDRCPLMGLQGAVLR